MLELTLQLPGNTTTTTTEGLTTAQLAMMLALGIAIAIEVKMSRREDRRQTAWHQFGRGKCCANEVISSIIRYAPVTV